jgi:hypothetical protein
MGRGADASGTAVVSFDSISPKGYDFRLYANQSARAAFPGRALKPCFD